MTQEKAEKLIKVLEKIAAELGDIENALRNIVARTYGISH
jgi:RNA polymerase-binding transcription factor DksA